MFGIEVNFKNGKKDWIDPVKTLPYEKDGKLYVEGVYTYDYELSEIDKWFKYDLCASCGHDKRSYECTDDLCMIPDD